MNTSQILFTNKKTNSQQISPLKSLIALTASCSEHLWLVITFILFLLMGPFSAIAVVIGLWNLTSAEYFNKSTEPTAQN